MARKIIALLCAVLVLAGLLAACGAPGEVEPGAEGGADTGAAKAVDFVPYDTEGLVVTPVPVTQGANTLSDEALIEIYETLYPQAEKAYACDLFETDMEDAFIDNNEQYTAITNFTDIGEIMRNYMALFSYELFQDTIFPVLFLLPMHIVPQDGAAFSIVHEKDGKLYLCNNEATFISGDKVDKAEVIYKSSDMFRLRLTFKWQDGSTQPYVLTIIDQNGIWVLDNFYWYDIVENKYYDYLDLPQTQHDLQIRSTEGSN